MAPWQNNFSFAFLLEVNGSLLQRYCSYSFLAKAKTFWKCSSWMFERIPPKTVPQQINAHVKTILILISYHTSLGFVQLIYNSNRLSKAFKNWKTHEYVKITPFPCLLLALFRYYQKRSETVIGSGQKENAFKYFFGLGKKFTCETSLGQPFNSIIVNTMRICQINSI